MKLVAAVIHGVVVATVAIVLLAVLASTVWHLKVLDVQTGSMQPAFNPGDALIMRPLRAQSLLVGMVVTYRSSRNPGELVTHRVVRIGSVGFQTQGDALTASDPPVRNRALVGRVVMIIPGLGKVLRWLQTWPGLVCLVYMPAACMAVSEIRRMERSIRKSRPFRDESLAFGV